LEVYWVYVRESGTAIRFAVLHKLDNLMKPGDINATINQSAPVAFTADPAFKKNCDLICIHHLDKLAEFKNYEEQIFEIEEDPHFYKKYVLYYSDTEVEAIKGLNFAKLNELISDKKQFDTYKNEPTAATMYSAAAKIFIKLPFLAININKVELVPLRLQIEDAVAESDLTKTYESIQKHDQLNTEDLTKELISDELENFKN
ncbi:MULTISPECIES: ABC-three component system middle component 1, partial [unclassified Serratia (in: enterobacteria)]|uniref:ABC-three component system middle component 1 n=1 Tax=unclassified Serratia (in: enterobacteria) TaxID=2647522 RepID=UPI00046A9D76